MIHAFLSQKVAFEKENDNISFIQAQNVLETYDESLGSIIYLLLKQITFF